MLAITGHTEDLKDLLVRFQTLSVHGNSIDGNGHRDGWGIGYYKGTIHLFKKAECAATSKEYKKAVEIVKNENPRIVVAHVRKASPGTRITDKEAHPFQNGNYLFCHNGSLLHQGGNPLGELDSVLYVKKIMETSLTRAIQYFWGFKYTSLTCLLTDGITVWAYRDFTEREDYYTLYYLQTENFILFCSEPLIKGEWVPLKNRELVTAFPDNTLAVHVLQR